MDYKDAFAIGSRAEGFIKCHYAELYSPTLGKLFSLQDADFSTKNAAAMEFDGKQTKNGEKADKQSGSDMQVYDRNEYSGNINDLIATIYYDIPIIEASEFMDYDETLPKLKRLVPVRLTSYVRKYLIQKLSKNTRTLYTVYMVNANNKDERHEIVQTYDRKRAYSYKDTDWWHYEVVVDPAKVLPKYQALIDGINENGVFYVRPVAIDWIPTDIQNIQITKDLAEAKRKLDAAKAILATAGAATILL